MAINNTKNRLFEVMGALDKTFINEDIDEGWGKNLVAGGLMAAATLGGMSQANASSRERPKEKTELQSASPVKSDSTNYRAFAEGISADMATAKKIAMSNAKTKIAKEMGGNQQSLNNISVDEEKAYRMDDGTVKCTVILSVPK